jgi:hypothetical protein
MLPIQARDAFCITVNRKIDSLRRPPALSSPSHCLEWQRAFVDFLFFIFLPFVSGFVSGFVPGFIPGFVPVSLFY